MGNTCGAGGVSSRRQAGGRSRHCRATGSPSWLRQNRSVGGGLAAGDFSMHCRQDVSTFHDDDALAPSAPKAPAAQPATRQAGAARIPPVSVNTRVEYAAIPSATGQDVFGLVTVQASAALEPQDTTKDRQPLDIVCVLDISGSMHGEKLELVQQAVSFLIKESQSHDRISIVAFNHEATRVLKLCRMEQHGKDQALKAVEELSSGGGTNIPFGVEMALEVVERRRHRNPVTAILLLTDGQDGSEGDDYAELLKRAQNAGSSLYTFGFGADHDDRLLSEIAEMAQTPFTFVEDVDQIGAAFAGAIGGLVSVAAQRVEVNLDCRTQLKAAHTPFPILQHGSTTTVKIPDMLAGERRDILVEFNVPVDPSCNGEVLLLTASAKYWDLQAETDAQTPSVEMRLNRTDEMQPEAEPDEEVARQRDRWEVTQTLKKASAFGEDGNFQEAQSVLSAHQAKLRHGRMSPISELLATELQDASDRLQSQETWEDGGRAELRDKSQMHLMQRTTNMSVSSKCRATSKAMYVTSVQQSWISKSIA